MCEGGISMTVVHILNFTIPIACILFAGILMDRMCKPEVPQPDNNNE